MMENKKRYEFNSVKPFDIIWAKRDVDDSEIYDENKCYEGSYIVVGRDENKLYCLSGLNKLKDYYEPYVVFSRLTKNKYGEEKNIYYINIDVKEIDYNKFINIKTRLNTEEKRDLLCGLKSQKNINQKECYGLDLTFKAGDIIKKAKEMYIVIYRNNNNLHCIEINDDRDLENSIYINNLKNINYKNTKIFNIDDDLTFVNKISTELFRKILNKYKEENYEIINYYNKIRNTNIGLVLELSDNLYYLYDIIEMDDLICYKIIPNNKEYDVFIAGNKFKIDLDNVINIQMKDNFKPICYPFYEESNYIDNLIKEKNKTKKLLK